MNFSLDDIEYFNDERNDEWDNASVATAGSDFCTPPPPPEDIETVSITYSDLEDEVFSLQDTIESVQNDSKSKNESAAIDKKELIKQIPKITSKFDHDAMCAIYRLSNKDTIKLAERVLKHYDNIEKIYCDATGRHFIAKIYYFNSNYCSKMFFVNSDASEKEIATWKTIKTKNSYCLKDLKRSV